MTTNDVTNCAEDCLDRLVDIVLGPVKSTVTATSSVAGTWIRRGQLGTLPDGRIVRATDSFKIATTGTPVRVRLYILHPFSPIGNFAAVTAGTTVTWTTPPAGINATAVVVSDFGSGDYPIVQGLAYWRQLPASMDPSAPGLAGSSCAVLHQPRLVFEYGGGKRGKNKYEWKLRAHFSSLAGSTDRQATSNDLSDALSNTIDSALVGSDIVIMESFTDVSKERARSVFELVFTSWLWSGTAPIDERRRRPDPRFAGVDATITLPGDGAQSPSFHVGVKINT